jgi:hypothetical protein
MVAEVSFAERKKENTVSLTEVSFVTKTEKPVAEESFGWNLIFWQKNTTNKICCNGV